MVSSSTASESPAAGPRVWVVRHGETEWSRAHRHTSVTDLPLTEVGEQAAVALRERLVGRPFARVLTSPRLRARRTAELAGFPGAEIDEDLVEWDYGDFEGMSTARIRETVPGWTIWTHASPGGESADAVAARLDRLIARVGAVDGGRWRIVGRWRRSSRWWRGCGRRRCRSRRRQGSRDRWCPHWQGRRRRSFTAGRRR